MSSPADSPGIQHWLWSLHRSLRGAAWCTMWCTKQSHAMNMVSPLIKLLVTQSLTLVPAATSLSKLLLFLLGSHNMSVAALGAEQSINSFWPGTQQWATK